MKRFTSTFSFLVLLLMASAVSVVACSCIVPSESIPVRTHVSNAKKEAAAVFSGKVVGFEYRKGIRNDAEEMNGTTDYETKVVKFVVDRSWKGDVKRVAYLVTGQTRRSDGSGMFSSCDYSFKPGEKYLVYAYREKDHLQTSACSRTSLVKHAQADVKALGRPKRL
jgi:hypothetical protein